MSDDQWRAVSAPHTGHGARSPVRGASMGHADAWRCTVPSPLVPAGLLAAPSGGAPAAERA
eukprot:746694-Alexandrium_andersonii.AAC.1